MREYGSEHPAIVLPDGYFESMEEYGREVLFMRSGREALLLAAIAASAEKDKTILFPAYCCWSMSAPFEKAGWKVIYYRLKEDLTVDIDYLRQLLEKEKPQAILTMNFYGSASTDDAVRMIKDCDEDIKVIEDFSHCTFSLKLIHNPKVNIYVSSIRKSIGVCDGAVILKQLAQVNGEEIAYARRKNMRHLWSLLNGKVEMVPGLERCMEGAPFSLPILIDNRDEVQSSLAKRGIYTQLLWPICEEAQQVCSVSKMMDARMLSVPIDQRYSWDDIEDMAGIICNVLNV